MATKLNKHEQKFIAKFDELEQIVAGFFEAESKDEAISEFEDVLIEAYLLGFQSAKEMLGFSDEMKPGIYSVLNYEYQGETIGSKFANYYDTKDIESIKRLLDSEYHRMYNKGLFNTAEEYRYTEMERGEMASPYYAPTPNSIAPEKDVYKTWITMGDEKVRETHQFLEGVSVRLWERFYTMDADSALFPGDFALARNNCNCRCGIRLSVKEVPKEEPEEPETAIKTIW